MKILKNKFFILGNIALLLVAIPLTLLFISRQQDLRSSAAPTTRITFSPQTISFDDSQCSEQTVTLRLDPGENIVSTVELFLTYDATKFDITIQPNEDVFPQILRGPTVSNGQASVELNIGSSVTKAIQAPVDFATITIIPVAETGNTPAKIQIDSSKTRVFSLSANDQTSENVFLSGGQVAISVAAACQNTVDTSPTPSAIVTPSATPSATPPITTLTPTPPSQVGNQSPICTTITASPGTSGIAPFVMTLTAQGSDTNGTIQKATFNFGDGTSQDVTDGMGNTGVTTELSHTYQTPGSYTASVVFTDNNGAVSTSCTQPITVTSNTQITPTTGGGIPATATLTPTPPIENPGGVGTTIAIVGGLLLVIIGGVVLVAL